MQRGFKSWCENTSLRVREELGMHSTDPLAHEVMAQFLEVKLFAPDEIIDLPDEVRLVLRKEGDNWSAVTISAVGRDAIIYNPLHRGGRRSSDVMHELAHVFIGHTPATVLLTQDRDLVLRSFNREQEDEANWLAWALLLPRPAVLQILNTNVDPESACERYGISSDVLRFRTNVTGAALQVGRRSSTRRPAGARRS